MLRLPGFFNVVRRALCDAAEEMGKKGMFFYAVRKGFRPGVYQTWEDCKHQVDKFPSAIFKKFASEQDAWAFVRSQSAAPSFGRPKGCDYEVLPSRNVPDSSMAVPLGSKRTYEDSDDEGLSYPKRVKLIEVPQPKTAAASSDGFTYMGDAIVVYTDGCCTANGKKGARAGIGVYWGRDHPLNVAERLPGRQTNQRAELQAACKALEQARENNFKKVVIYTDSKFTINGITSWVKTWKSNGWRLKGGGAIVNKEDFQKLDKLNAELEVEWMHIPGHAGYTGNEEADRLSREGAAKPPC
ncbi:ribonuclease H1-like isoform X1 [Sinocyclocheilus rhinocerous]|uniref:Ribonuclease H1 n=2 Tax=Sinocyclocheilus rhinocerous TaxID=307959 RepID=A0A673JRY9_9TELE|nr:PREDICTED: ribonuclease H1-like isoform X1 [Sinocyclocheilus rhinocerous]